MTLPEVEDVVTAHVTHVGALGAVDTHRERAVETHAMAADAERDRIATRRQWAMVGFLQSQEVPA